MIKGVITKSHGVVILTMTGLLTQSNWTLQNLEMESDSLKINNFQKDALEHQLAHFVNFSISGFFYPLTTSAFLLGLISLRYYNHYTNYEKENQEYFQLAQIGIIGSISLLGLSVPCRYILLNKHR